MMENRQNGITRREALKHVAVLGAGLVLVPSAVLGYEFNGDAKFVRYKNHSPLSKEKLCRLAGPNYPNDFVLNYKIPENDRGFTGGFRLTKNPNLVELLARFKHERENRLIRLTERIENGRRFYQEYVYDFKEGKAEYAKPEREVTSITAPQLVRQFFDENLNRETKFNYWGDRKENDSKKHKLETYTIIDKNGDIIRSGKIEDDDPKLKRLMILVREGIPEKIDVEYNIVAKDFGLWSLKKDITVRGTLTESLDEELFRI